MKKYFLTCIFIIVSQHVLSQTPTFTDVDYVGDGHPRHMMDIYIPPGVNTPSKTIIFIHGGGWRSGSKALTMRHCKEFYNSNYVVVGINYRLSQDSIFPAQIYDCKTAVRFLKSNASSYSIDTSRIGVTGTSAGGHLVALLGASNGEAGLEGLHLGSTGASSNVHAVADFFGPTDFLQMDANVPGTCVNPMVHEVINSPESQVLGCLITSCPDKVNKANPITYINGNEPPFSVHHGQADCLVPYQQSVLLHDSLIANGQNSELTLYPGGGHGNFINSSVLTSMVNFFDSVFDDNVHSSGSLI